MNNNVSEYDLYAIIQEALDEDQEVKYNRGEAESFVKNASDNGYHQKSTKGKKSKKSKEVKDEDFDVIDDDGESEDTEPADSESEEKPEPTTVRLEDAVDYQKFKDDLNMFRAAHSFSDKVIGTELRQYFESLTKEEKQALHVMIKGLIHVTLMDVKGKSAKTPADFSLSIKKTGATSKEKQKSLDNRISLEKKGKKVDSSTPISTPIKIGESYQNKNNILKVLKLNKT